MVDGYMSKQLRLFRKNGQVFLDANAKEDEVAVRILLAAPLTEGSHVVSIMHATEKRELALLFTLDDLDEDSRLIINEEIRKRYFLPKIEKVNSIDIYLGDYYWDVVTDRGTKKFTLSTPVVNIRWLSDTRLLLNSADGLHYELPDITRLDQESQRCIDNIL